MRVNGFHSTGKLKPVELNCDKLDMKLRESATRVDIFVRELDKPNMTLHLY